MAGRIDFRVGTFDDLIDKHGYYLTHYHALQCPCINVETGHPDPNCSWCTNGWQYFGEHEVRGIISSISSERQFMDTGGMLLGAMNLTVKANVELGYHDRIINTKSVISYSELITRSSGQSDVTRFPVIDISRVVSPGGVVFVPVADYSVANGAIQWAEGAGPAEDTPYSIAYRMHPQWCVLSMTHLVRDVHIKFRNPAPELNQLPIQALCKLEFLL